MITHRITHFCREPPAGSRVPYLHKDEPALEDSDANISTTGCVIVAS